VDYPHLGVCVQVLEVPRSHSTADLALTDGSKGEVVPLAHHLIDGLCLRVATLADSLGHAGSLERNLLDDLGCVDVGGCWGRHGGGCKVVVYTQVRMFCKYRREEESMILSQVLSWNQSSYHRIISERRDRSSVPSRPESSW